MNPKVVVSVQFFTPPRPLVGTLRATTAFKALSDDKGTGDLLVTYRQHRVLNAAEICCQRITFTQNTNTCTEKN